MASIEFLGCGEACDPGEPNTSFLFHGREACMLFDCGFTVPHLLAGRVADPDRLDGVWVSHFHGDHLFGLPLLLLKLADMGRRRELVLAGPAGLAERTRALVDLAYGSLARDCGFFWRVIEMVPGAGAVVAGMRLVAAASQHGGNRALAVRADCGRVSVFYSGDGRPSAAAVDLARGVDLAVLECFEGRSEVPGHNNFTGVMDLVARAAPRRAALVHVRCGGRQGLARLLAGEQGGASRLFIPRGGRVVDL